jgi:NDP-sugar pyrophosphorylase family protein
VRFQAAGVKTPKALIEVGGRSLLLGTLGAFADAGFSGVSVVVNHATAAAVRAHLAEVNAPVSVDLVVKTTASTLETFGTLLDLGHAAGAKRFVFTTVDAVTGSGELARFAEEASRAAAPLALGVAEVEAGDETPLRVELGADGLARLGRGHLATAGFYAGDLERVRAEAEVAHSQGVPSLRAFLTHQSALSVVRGIVLGRALDVDSPSDVARAERALASWRNAAGEAG